MFRQLSALILLFLFSFPAAFASDGKKPKNPAKPQVLTEHDRALHALERLTFGPRPGDIEKVLSLGVDNWVEQQLNPVQLPNTNLDARLAPYRTLRMQPKELVQTFPNGQLIREAADKKRTLPSDPVQYGLWEVLVTKYNEQQQANAAAAKPTPTPDDAAQKAAEQTAKDTARNVANMLLSLPKAERMPTLMRMPMSDRRALVQYVPGDLVGRLISDFSPAERETYYSMNNPTGVVVSELQQAKVLRAVYSERQMEEVMTDFWFNHFNVFLNKDQDQYFVTTYERDVIRPNALGKFRDLLGAVAKNPAMLFYLDNWLSIGPNSQASGVKPGQPPKPGARGLNENYGRELMELHTLGVDGGYTQNDVTQVARVFTGWTIQPLDQGWGFMFDPKRHDPGPKVVLGKSIPENGINEGMQVLDMLCKNPATAKFISTKLARRFVADDPPPALVNQMAKKFLDSDGDIKEVLRTMFRAKEFWSVAVYRKKVKTPLEFVASAIRATGTQVQNPMPIVQALNKMGMPLYQMQPPTGYSTKAETWMNSDALLERLNFSVSLTGGSMGGINFDPLRVLALGLLARAPKEDVVPVNTNGGTNAAVTLVEDALVGGTLSPNSDAAIRKSLEDPLVAGHLLDDPAKPLATIIGLTLGSPEFQLR
ncbi:MAG TPA: DUF1800 domain-containing protein [Candidatus Solibacter sp.]|nr:DUF1800 domain-containing protein [Candidatus Solibacter sp.]